MRRTDNRWFWSGWLSATAGLSLFQDALGRDRYIELCREHWIPANVSVPIAILMIGVAVVLAIRAAEEEAS